MGSRTYYRTEDCLDNGYERAFKHVYATKGGSQPFIGLAGCLRHPKAMRPWAPGKMPREDEDEKS